MNVHSHKNSESHHYTCNECHSGMLETIGLGHLPFDILEQNMNIKSTEDNKKSLKYVLISCIPRSSTSFFFPYLLLLSIRYPSRYSSMDTHFSNLDAEGSFEGFTPSWCGANLKIVKNAEDQSLRTLWNAQKTKFPFIKPLPDVTTKKKRQNKWAVV